MTEYLHGPETALPNFNDKNLQNFLDSPGSITNIPPQSHGSVYANHLKNHAIVPFSKLNSIESNNVDPTSDSGVLIEHLATGIHYFVYREQEVTSYYDQKEKVLKEKSGESKYKDKGKTQVF